MVYTEITLKNAVDAANANNGLIKGRQFGKHRLRQWLTPVRETLIGAHGDEIVVRI